MNHTFERMKRSRCILDSILSATGICALSFLFVIAARAEDRHYVLEGIDGDVTTNEYKSFIDKLPYLPPPPTNNIDNSMADEKDGARLHGLQTFYSFTHDRRVLDMAIIWSDAFLHARNDPTNGRVIWTGKRDLCWPNKTTNDVQALHAGADSGDVIEHIVNTARVLLETPEVWNKTAPADQFGFGATYLDRAKTYVRECQRSAETTMVPWYVRSTKDGYRLYYPDSPAYLKYTDGPGPMPWNQQQCVVGALLRLAQCHRLLNDGNTNIAYYEKITADTANWFFSCALPVSAQNHVCYLWSYGLPRDPAYRPEVTYESDYDMFIFRAYQADLGPSRLQMQRLINTGRYIMYLGTNRISGYINGTSDNNSSRHERTYFSFEWIEASVLDHEFYKLVAGTAITSREYLENLAVEAAVLSSKHYWATHSPTPEPQESLDPAKLRPAIGLANKQTSSSSSFMAVILRHTPAAARTPAAAMLLAWILSGLVLLVARRLDASAAAHDPWSGTVAWIYLIVVGLGVLTAFQLRAATVLWADAIIWTAVFLLGFGLALQWYARIQTVGLIKANVAGLADDRDPSHFIRLSYAGGALAMIALGLSFKNWASLLIMGITCCAVTLLRIRATASSR